MFLHRNDVNKIQDILEKFPDVETFEIHQDNTSGIGSTTTITFNQKTNNVSGSFKVTISGVENW